MVNPFEDDSRDFCVLINGEGQYSLWPTFKKVPDGWSAVGPRGARTDCLSFIEENWTDMRPKSLIRKMEQAVAK
jgi:MbtH protein